MVKTIKIDLRTRINDLSTFNKFLVDTRFKK